MEQIASDLIDNSDLIARQTLEDWKDLADREPWHRLPPELDMDHLPQLIRDLARTALGTFFGAEERRDLAFNSVKHGEHRFETAVSEEMLSREYELLRWALWQRLKGMWPSEDASQAIIRLDSALSFAQGATLRGYHRRVIEQTGDWPDALDRYLEEWAFPFR
jgi:hypothetical protein